jgi:hypothetical protein
VYLSQACRQGSVCEAWLGAPRDGGGAMCPCTLLGEARAHCTCVPATQTAPAAVRACPLQYHCNATLPLGGVAAPAITGYAEADVTGRTMLGSLGEAVALSV